MNVIEVLAFDAERHRGARSTWKSDVHPSVHPAEMMPFIVAMQVVRTSLGKSCHGVDKASVACEMNIARAAGGLLVLKHLQTQTAVLTTTCPCVSRTVAERESRRNEHFSIHKLPDVDVAKLSSAYARESQWPDDMYWCIWYAMCVHEALKHKCSSLALADRVAQTVTVMRAKYEGMRDSAHTRCSSAVLSNMSSEVPLIDPKFVHKVFKYNMKCANALEDKHEEDRYVSREGDHEEAHDHNDSDDSLMELMTDDTREALDEIFSEQQHKALTIEHIDDEPAVADSVMKDTDEIIDYFHRDKHKHRHDPQRSPLSIRPIPLTTTPTGVDEVPDTGETLKLGNEQVLDLLERAIATHREPGEKITQESVEALPGGLSVTQQGTGESGSRFYRRVSFSALNNVAK